MRLRGGRVVGSIFASPHQQENELSSSSDSSLFPSSSSSDTSLYYYNIQRQSSFTLLTCDTNTESIDTIPENIGTKTEASRTDLPVVTGVAPLLNKKTSIMQLLQQMSSRELVQVPSTANRRHSVCIKVSHVLFWPIRCLIWLPLFFITALQSRFNMRADTQLQQKQSRIDDQSQIMSRMQLSAPRASLWMTLLPVFMYPAWFIASICGWVFFPIRCAALCPIYLVKFIYGGLKKILNCFKREKADLHSPLARKKMSNEFSIGQLEGDKCVMFRQRMRNKKSDEPRLTESEIRSLVDSELVSIRRQRNRKAFWDMIKAILLFPFRCLLSIPGSITNLITIVFKGRKKGLLQRTGSGFRSSTSNSSLIKNKESICEKISAMFIFPLKCLFWIPMWLVTTTKTVLTKCFGSLKTELVRWIKQLNKTNGKEMIVFKEAPKKKKNKKKSDRSSFGIFVNICTTVGVAYFICTYKMYSPENLDLQQHGFENCLRLDVETGWWSKTPIWYIAADDFVNKETPLEEGELPNLMNKENPLKEEKRPIIFYNRGKDNFDHVYGAKLLKEFVTRGYDVIVPINKLRKNEIVGLWSALMKQAEGRSVFGWFTKTKRVLEIEEITDELCEKKEPYSGVMIEYADPNNYQLWTKNCSTMNGDVKEINNLMCPLTVEADGELKNRDIEGCLHLVNEGIQFK